jgi:hypothetical protein
MRRPNPGESLQDFTTAIEMLARHAYPNLPAEYVAREAGKAFTYEIRDDNIKIQLLLGGEKTVNEALRQALELQAVLVAARSYENNTNIYLKHRSFPTQQRDTQQSRCWNCGEPGHFESNCHYSRRNGDSTGTEKTSHQETSENHRGDQSGDLVTTGRQAGEM